MKRHELGTKLGGFGEVDGKTMAGGNGRSDELFEILDRQELCWS